MAQGPDCAAAQGPDCATAQGSDGAASPAAARAAALQAQWALLRPQDGPVRVQDLQRIFGGASRETWRFRLQRADGSVQPMILRLDPADSLIATEREREAAALRAFEGSEVPVPQVVLVQADPRPLGGAFMAMRAIEGGEAGPMRLAGPAYAGHHDRMAEQTWRTLGRIACRDPAALGDARSGLDAATAWSHELEHWAEVLQRESAQPQPIAQAALRWLRRHPPPPAQRLAVVHGDYRIGNLLFAPDGELLGVLDWEMAHAGDPLEDLAWGLGRVWCFNRDERVCGIAARAQAIAHWERASGLRAEPQALHWWELLNALKGQAIWLGAARAFERGENTDLMMAFAAWMLSNSQDRAILELMGQLP